MSVIYRALWPFALAAALIACSGDPGPTVYEVRAENNTGGQITPSQRQVEAGQTTSFTITPDPGYELQSITGCGGERTRDIFTTDTVQSDCTVSARFQLSDYRISTQVSGLGTLSPESALVTIEDTTEFVVLPAEDYRLASISGCGGRLEDDRYTVAEVSAACTISVRFEPDVYTVSGTLNATALNQFDGTLNDASTELALNDSFDTPQFINNRTTLAGFATAEPADIDPRFPAHFADTPNPADYYRVSLQEGQLIQLQVVDYAPVDSDETRYQGDLDLYLYSATEDLVGSSTGTGEFEELTIAETGDYLIEVTAAQGTSKYILRLLPEGTAPQTDLSQTQSGDFVPGQMLVIPAETGRKSLSKGQPARVLLEQSVPLSARAYHHPGSALASLSQRNPAAYQKLSTLRAIKARRLDPAVALAEPNYLRQVQRVPNDPRYDLQWHYDVINLPRAWDLTTGTPETGDAPIIAVVDTGVILEHPDLQGQLRDGYDFIRDDERANDNQPGIDADPSDPGDGDSLDPDSWHGTHVAGTVAAASDNGEGGAGIAWGAQIMPLRALGVGGGTSYDILQSVLYAAGLENDSGTLPERPADIINLSLGGPGNSQVEADTFRQISEALGILVVASSGNENTAEPLFPASYPTVISVGATTAAGQRAPYSNFGETLDVVAPGGNLGEDANGDAIPDGILSTSGERDASGAIQPGYSLSYQGTSMAAPHVAGVAALMKAVYPGLTAAEFTQLLEQGDLTAGDGTRSDELGYGQIDAELAVGKAYQIANDADFQWPARVSVQPSRVNLGTTSETLVELISEGEGEPDSITFDTDVSWLAVEPFDVQSNGLGRYRITVDRAPLEDSPGFYRGRVLFTVDSDSTLTLEVFMEVGTVSTTGQLTRTYVLLIDQDDAEGTAYQAVAVPTDTSNEEATFEITGVLPGRYSVVAGSDIDADGIICQLAEQCGAYPSLEREQVIEVTDANRSGLDFTLGILGGLLESSAQQGSGAPEPPTTYSRHVSPPERLRQRGPQE
ncbi:S8 family serine peptidase [Marinimicrobium sp. C6131]|uniref:S8 family serine peptidase n=1 Tax=Marinimicrobium sp. C6131 TaxID=3022676 RepID=UPI00223E77EA|nr:S8 family serine peptidase [Marinimicrobium sp. C6131]UZJ43934.1 S8 family serine peptidase [Marinimicrobium sp. C6131]